MNFRTISRSLLMTALLSPTWSAQAGNPSSKPAVEAPQVKAAMRDWRDQNGANWRIRTDRATGYARMLFGGSAPSLLRPRSDAEYFSVAREHLAQAQAVTGVDPATLENGRVHLLPLGRSGGVDKMSVEFKQNLSGIPVNRGWVNMLLGLDGTLLSIDAQALPNLELFDRLPQVTGEQAVAFARAKFAAASGFVDASATQPRLVIRKEMVDDKRVPTLVWEFEVSKSDSEGQAARLYSISARGPMRVVADENQVHSFDVGGTLTTRATAGTAPDVSTNPASVAPMAYATVTGPTGSTTTDENGFFNFPGLTGPATLGFTYQGLYNSLSHATTNAYSLTQSVTGTGNVILMNPSATEDVTAEANVFVTINEMRDWLVNIDPTDLTMDVINTARVMIEEENLGGFLTTGCNAYFTTGGGGSTNYFHEDAGCVNTAYSTIIAHEQGHWLNVRYSSGNGPDGFGEGNADTFAMYLYDNPIVGLGFSGPGTIVRSGDNTSAYCGDGNGGCYGQVHADGLPHMGAMWKMRRNLKAANGVSLGGAIADDLFIAWMNGYNQGEIDSVILTQLLTLDDDDGDIENGTPNFTQINAAFVEQNFPEFELTLVIFDNVVTLEDTPDEDGPYGIAADVATLDVATIANVSAVLDLGAGPLSIPMQNVSGSTYSALTPGFASPAVVEYYITATDTKGNTATWPRDAATNPALFFIGKHKTYLFEHFDGPSDAGWSHGVVFNQDDWQRAAPAGDFGTSEGIGWSDPSMPFSGSKCWGNDLIGGLSDGAYRANTSNYLRSPLIDLSASVDTKLTFRRWLSVEQREFDEATVRLNGTDIWTNPSDRKLVDKNWERVSILIPQADGNPFAQIEFALESDEDGNLGGWNIDDVEVFSLEPTPNACQTLQYGTGTSGTGFLTPVVDTGGEDPTVGNQDFRLVVKKGLPNSTAAIGLGVTPASIPLVGGTLLLVPDTTAVFSLDQFGQRIIPIPLGPNPFLAGVTLYAQTFVSDPGAFQGFAISRGLEFTICN